jgi:hypothetical protein
LKIGVGKGKIGIKRSPKEEPKKGLDFLGNIVIEFLHWRS